MRCDCDEFLWLGESQEWDDRVTVRVESDVDAEGNVILLSVRPYDSDNLEIGQKVEYGDCILSQLSSQQIEQLKEAMRGHAED